MVVDGNTAKDFIEDNDETQEWDLTRKANQDLEMPIYYVGLDIVKPHVVSCTLGKYIPYSQFLPCSQMSQLTQGRSEASEVWIIDMRIWTSRHTASK